MVMFLCGSGSGSGSGSGRVRGIRGYTCYEFQQISLKTYAISFVK
jgi:hypothetical protein